MALYSLLKLVALCALVHEAAAFAPVPGRGDGSVCKEGDICVLGDLGACCSGTRDPPTPPLKCVPPRSPDLLPTCQYDTCSMLKGKPCDPAIIGGCCVSGCCYECVPFDLSTIVPPSIYWCQPGEA